MSCPPPPCASRILSCFFWAHLFRCFPFAVFEPCGAGAFGADHAGADRGLRLADAAEKFAGWRVDEAAEDFAAAAAGCVVLGFFCYAESFKRVEFAVFFFELQCAFWDFSKPSPVAVRGFETFVDNILSDLVSLFGDDGGVNCFCFGFALGYLPADFGEAFDYLHWLETRHDAGFAELFDNRLKRAVTYNDADVAGAEKRVYFVALSLSSACIAGTTSL